MFRKIWNKFHAGVFVDACKCGDKAQVDMMLEEEPELAYIKDKKGNSVLFHAVANGHVSIVESLLRITRQPDDVESEKGFTPLLVAATNGHMAIVRVLLEHGANPNLRNFDGVTALHNAVFENQIDVVKLLLEHGADPDIQDRLNNTPVDLARTGSNSKLIQLFKQYEEEEDLIGNDIFSILLYNYQKADALFVKFVQKEVDNGRKSNTLKLRTSASAFVASLYFVKQVPIEDGNVLAPQKAEDTLIEIIPLFNHTSQSIYDHLIEQGKIDLSKVDRKEIKELMDGLFHLQQNKLTKYSGSIVGMIDRGERGNFGTDLASLITYDLFEESVFDPLFQMELLDIMGSFGK
ncbi:MAG: ankyrin repeat domain-containing protein [Bacilli bacterium]|nr:ankyrin repeat domain-containing protein [Bacilli bacterium]